MQAENIVRTLRRKAGLTQAELAAALGVSRSHLSKVENGEDQPGGALKEALAVFFKVPIDTFFPAAATAIRADSREPQNNEERALLEAWRAMPADQREALLVLIRGRSDSP